MDMQDSHKQAANFLETVFEQTGLELQVELRETPGGPVLDFDGPDADLLQTDGGELLDALQHLINQAFGRSLEDRQRLVCDVKGFRATREAELRAMANHAAERVRSTGLPFTFGPMNASERRTIHLALADREDLHTESIGEGSERKLKVSLKNAT
jgi:spoIIIJ-associated protein